ncbi:MAG: MBL fold metallo-hydrolase [Cyanobacteria bacterium P01_F01_bin.42]
MYLTWYGSNSWLIELANQRILLDPWLVGPLVFGNQSWFFKAEQGRNYDIPEDIDLILLSQGLPDHAHPPTLEALDKSIPVWGSPNAIKVADKFGFKSTTAIEIGQNAQQSNLKVEAFSGSQIGPMLIENAYVIRDLDSGSSLYYEPHGFHHESLDSSASIDAAIVPLIDLTIMNVGTFIKGGAAAKQLAKQVNPRILIPTTVGGDVNYSGVLNAMLRENGDLDSLRQQFQQENLDAKILDPLPTGERIEVPLESMVQQAV